MFCLPTGEKKASRFYRLRNSFAQLDANYSSQKSKMNKLTIQQTLVISRDYVPENGRVYRKRVKREMNSTNTKCGAGIANDIDSCQTVRASVEKLRAQLTGHARQLLPCKILTLLVTLKAE